VLNGLASDRLNAGFGAKGLTSRPIFTYTKAMAWKEKGRECTTTSGPALKGAIALQELHLLERGVFPCVLAPSLRPPSATE
jgi:hypothetical protein